MRRHSKTGETIQANVAAMTGLTISLDEAVRQRHFFVAPERLSREEFEQAERLFTREYEGIRPGSTPEKPIFAKTSPTGS